MILTPEYMSEVARQMRSKAVERDVAEDRSGAEKLRQSAGRWDAVANRLAEMLLSDPVVAGLELYQEDPPCPKST